MPRLLAWCFADEQTPSALEAIERLKASDQGFVPAFWSPFDVLNSLLAGEKRGRISAEQTRAFLGNSGDAIITPKGGRTWQASRGSNLRTMSGRTDG